MSGGTFVPHQLFASGSAGAWYDPSDFSTLYQNSTGTTPVTAVEQPVGLMLDRSRGLVLGSELVSNPGPFVNTTGWTVSGGTLSVVNGSLVVTSTGAGSVYITQNFTSVSGRSYYCTASTTGSGIAINTYRTGPFTNFMFTIVVNGTAIGQSTDTDTTSAVTMFMTAAGAGETWSLNSISIKELPGNHAVQATSASRPVLRSRYNLLTYSEELNNAIWSKNNASVVANQYVDSQGTSTLDRVLPTAGNATHYLQYTITYTATQHTLSFEARYDNHRWIAVTTWDGTTNRNASFDLLNGVVGATLGGATSSITSLGSGLYRCVVTFTPLGVSGNFTIGPNDIDAASIRTWSAAGTEAFGLGRVSLLTAADETSTGGAYQRIAAATDYDTSNPVWRPYLAFDGTDDSFSTSSIDFSGTDEMTVFAGVTKLSDAGRATVVELGTGGVATETFFINAPRNAATDNIGFASAGSSVHEATASGVPAPITRVVTGIGDISGDVATLRLNGVQAATNTGNQGTGNYANAALFIGRRNNTFDPLNGRIYALAVLGRTATAAELTAMEAWVAGKTGVTL